MTPVSALDHIVYGVLDFGWVGVDLFFVLSGFLITGILVDSKPGAHYFRNFYIRRVLRIFPLYYGFLAAWLVILPAFYMWPADVDVIPVSPFWSWAYLVNIIQSVHDDWRAAPPYASHLWSLAIEEQFYLCWPAVVFLCSRRRLLTICTALIVVGIFTRLTLMSYGFYTSAYLITPARLDALAVGAIIAVLARRPAGFPIASYRPVLFASTAGFTLLIVQHVTGVASNRYLALLLSSIDHTAVAGLCGALLVMAIDGRSAVARFLSGSPLRFFGRYSYALYVFHLPVIYFIERYWFKVDSAPLFMGTRLWGLLLFAVVAGGASVVLAYLSWHGYEKHFLKLKDRFTYKRPSVTVEAYT
jgi:peptidoglycan/LPS O-acetylase OafA/YrhL